MDIQADELIKEIAIKNGVLIGRDDPILMLHTINHKLLNDSSIAQQKMLDQFKSELEELSHRWGNDAKDKAEKILNAALIASKEVMTKQLTESATVITQLIKKEVDQSLLESQKPLKMAHYIATINIAASIITLLASCFLIIGFMMK